jgi:hypothetical protein
MTKIKEAASAFLASKRVAVTGVSRQPKGHGGNIVYQRLRTTAPSRRRAILTPLAVGSAQATFPRIAPAA